ncbi:GDP-6-deoxy-D-mannose reductase [Streptococcus sp. BCA20]|nr:GDP-6-deoxy-D-mannose reductase [Streptococcus sp. BCA20]
MYTLVTGATGFIGKRLVKRLVDEGRRVKCLVRNSSDIAYLSSLGVEFIYGDILEATSYSKELVDVEIVYHLAGNTKPNNFSQLDSYKINTEGTKILLDSLCNYLGNIKKIVIVSSIAATGPSLNGKPLTEESPMLPITSYGESKKMGELLAREYYLEYGLPIVVVRPPMVYGVGDRDWSSFFKMIKLASINDRKLFLPGNHKNKIDFCYVDNLVEALICAEITNRTIGGVYFASDNQSYSIQEIVDAVCLAYGITPPSKYYSTFFCIIIARIFDFISKILHKEMPVGVREVNWMTKDYWVCDISKLKRDTNYTAKISLREGIKKTIESIEASK